MTIQPDELRRRAGVTAPDGVTVYGARRVMAVLR